MFKIIIDLTGQGIGGNWLTGYMLKLFGHPRPKNLTGIMIENLDKADCTSESRQDFLNDCKHYSLTYICDVQTSA